MLRCNSIRLGSAAINKRRLNKYPELVAYNKVPWLMLSADSPKLHAVLAPHYAQILSLAAACEVPHLVNDYHIDIPESQWLISLPSALYVLPHVQSAFNGDPAAFGPYGWAYQPLQDSAALQYYGPVEAAVQGRITSVLTYKSPDLRLICNAVTFAPGAGAPISPMSSFAEMVNSNNKAAENSSNNSNKNNSNTSNNGKGMPDFALFHFFRPNRPAAEISKPLEQYYRHPLAAATVSTDLARFSNPAGWKPVLGDGPKRSGERAKLTPPAPFKPPTSYICGLYDRLAIRPGDCFGRRNLMWGTYF